MYTGIGNPIFFRGEALPKLLGKRGCVVVGSSPEWNEKVLLCTCGNGKGGEIEESRVVGT